MTTPNIVSVIQRMGERIRSPRYPGTRFIRGYDHDSIVIDTRKQIAYWNSRGLAGGVEFWLKYQGLESSITDEDRQEWLSKKEAQERRIRQDQLKALEKIKSLNSRAEYYYSSLTPAAITWWEEKGLTLETIKRYRLGYAQQCPTYRQSDSYTIPYYRDGQLVNLRHRLARPGDTGKYRPEFGGLGNQLFNVDRLKRHSDLMEPGEVVIVEGEIKACVLDQAGFRVIAVPGASAWQSLIDDLRTILKPFTRVFVALDPGEAGEKQGAALALALAGKAIRARLPDKPDDLLLAGWTPERLYKALAPKLAEERERRQAKAEAQAAADQAREEEERRRWGAGNVTPFLGDEVDPDQVEYLRNRFGSAKKWAEYVAKTWPDLDPEEQRQIKLAENKEKRIQDCQEKKYSFRKLPGGGWQSYRQRCGICEDCLKLGVMLYRRALCEIQGIGQRGMPVPGPIAETLYNQASMEGFQPGPAGKSWDEFVMGELGQPWIEPDYSSMLFPDDLKTTTDIISNYLDDLPQGESAGEDSPPLAIIHGPLTVVRVLADGETDKERINLGRRLARRGIRFRCQPADWEDQPGYDFIVNSDMGEPLSVLTDERLMAWVKSIEGKRASGDLLPALEHLKNRYREALPYEVVMPEMAICSQLFIDEETGEYERTEKTGRLKKCRQVLDPVDPDIFALDLPSLPSQAPEVAIDFEVYDASTLQAALIEIHKKQLKILKRREMVDYRVCKSKKFYTRYSTIDALIAEFNAEQAAIRAKQGLPPL